MELILIVAMAKNRVIGFNNSIPWHIPEEVQFFKKSTMSHAMIMGRKTFESIGRPLPGRLNVVLTRDRNWHFPGCEVAADLTAGIACCEGYQKIFVIGGSKLFEESMDRADTILLSVIDGDYEGDTFFPNIPSEQFFQASEEKLGKDQPFIVYTFKRKPTRLA